MSSLRNNYARITGNKGNSFTRFLTDDGTGDQTANENLNADGSGTPLKFWVQPPAGTILTLNEITVSITDGGNPAHDDYGNINGPLVNGSYFFIEQKGVERKVSRDLNENDDFIPISRSFDILQFGSVRVIVYRDMLPDTTSGIKLNGDTNDKFGIYIRDNLTNLIEHNCHVKGLLVNKANL